MPWFPPAHVRLQESDSDFSTSSSRCAQLHLIQRMRLLSERLAFFAKYFPSSTPSLTPVTKTTWSSTLTLESALSLVSVLGDPCRRYSDLRRGSGSPQLDIDLTDLTFGTTLNTAAMSIMVGIKGEYVSNDAYESKTRAQTMAMGVVPVCAYVSPTLFQKIFLMFFLTMLLASPCTNLNPAYRLPSTNRFAGSRSFVSPAPAPLPPPNHSTMPSYFISPTKRRIMQQLSPTRKIRVLKSRLLRGWSNWKSSLSNLATIYTPPAQ